MLEKKVSLFLEKINSQDPKMNSFLYINPKALEEAREIDKKQKKGKLYSLAFGIKSNINVLGFPTSCASKTLESYSATYDASVISKIKEEDGLILGMLNMDEFASGGSGEYSAFKPTQNPSAPGFIPGGSSSGSAAAVAANFCDIALGSDTGGSVRNPASHCGVVGIKPSYGLVSRHGLIDLAMSLDQIGICAKNVNDAFLVLDVIKGKDEKDTASLSSPVFKKETPGNIFFGVLKIRGVDPRIESLINQTIEKISKELKWKKREVKIKHMDLAVETYYLLAYAELFSATRRLDGRRYGKKIEDSCGPEVLRRILGGSEITRAEFEEAYYQKALQAKELIKEEFESVFKEVDCVLCPTVPSLPWKIGQSVSMSPEEIYAADALTIPANLAEICALSLPAGKINNIPIGLQIMCAKLQDNKLLNLASEIEKTLAKQ